tara:strand:- start:33 stop:431 length:399 start_codon:yes stop_codon:yes gene_type:complete
MNKGKLGNKHLCSNCGIKFFDLKKEIPECPNCGTQVIIRTKPRLGRPPLNKNKEKEVVKPNIEESKNKNPVIEENEIEITGDIDNIISIEDIDPDEEISETEENINLLSNQDNNESISDITDLDINDENTEN